MINLTSKITKALLKYFFLHEEQELYFNEIAETLELDRRNLSKKLKALVSEGLFKVEEKGNQKYYSLNKNYPLYNEYKKIVLKTLGFEAELSKVFKDRNDINRMYIYGSYAENRMDASSDIDLLIVGNISIQEVNRLIQRIQSGIEREINVTLMDEAEFKQRRENNDLFITAVMDKNIQLI